MTETTQTKEAEVKIKVIKHYTCRVEKLPIYGFVDVTNLSEVNDIVAKARFIQQNDVFVFE